MSGPVPNARARRIEESPTLAIIGRAAKLRAEGKDVIALGAGEPDFPTPTPIAEAGVAAIRGGRTRYTAAAGTAELRQAGARWFASTYGIGFTADEVLVTAGAKPALHMALNTVVEKGDRVLILAPYWVSYPALVTMADGEPVILPPVPEQGFVHAAEAIDAAAARTGAKGLLVNFPNNPSGACASRAQVEAIVQVCRERGMWILSDEIYGLLRYGGSTHTSPAAVPAGRERTMVVNGFTKSHTMTGWRIGFLAGPQPLIAAAARIQSQVLGNACTISQEAALHGCQHPLSEEVARRVQAFDDRRRYLVEELNRIDGLRLRPPEGAFYALVDVRSWCERLRCDDIGLAERLLEQKLLAGVPGSAFGIPGFVRFSYAASLDELRRAVERLQDFRRSLA
jgi:aspartate aminotransferase